MVEKKGRGKKEKGKKVVGGTQFRTGIPPLLPFYF